MPNTRQYEWDDISIVFLGKTISGIVAVEYGADRKKDYVYGRGNDPLSIQRGQKKYEGEITLLQSEYTELAILAKTVNPKYDITDISFDIAISYGVGAQVVRDIIRSAEFTEAKKGMKNEDTHMEIKLPFMALGIDENV